MNISLYLLGMVSFASLASSELVELPKFNDDEFHQWQSKVFSGETQYTVLSAKNILHAQSIGSASGLMFSQKIDLEKTPYINWRWKIDKKLENLAENTKAGDDYAARIYLVRNEGMFMWNVSSLNYVWSSDHAAGEHWDNAYAGAKVKMLAIRDASAEVGVWYSEKRNVFQDMVELFGDKGSEQANLDSYQFIDVVALMTDTDNSALEASSYYGHITFSAE